MNIRRTLSCLLAALLICILAYAQENADVTDSANVSVTKLTVAGNYDRSNLHNWLFGKHYRTYWSTPVRMQTVRVDTLWGGLIPYEAGGGRQSKSLHMRDSVKHEYVMRSVDKSFGRALPAIYKGTFVEDLIDDQVTIAHPYAPLTVPIMAQSAQILHTMPILRYVPSQPALGKYDREFANKSYLFEQRPDEDWSTADNFGNSDHIIGTDKLLGKLQKDHSNKIDQLLYVRSRLFDMFIGDWGRHEDQWRWASFKQDSLTLYKPIPRDRDQAYAKFDGALVALVIRAGHLKYLQSFDDDIRNVNAYNFTARHLDRRMANEVTKEEWLSIARELQSALTNDVIETSVQQMPPEVFVTSGPEIIAKLKARRDHLPEWAATYYAFLARHIDIPGSAKDEYFEVKRLDDDRTMVSVYGVEKGQRSQQPFYKRLFFTSETRDIRLYGIGGNDVFHVDGNVKKGTTVRVIGGPLQDSIIDRSDVRTQHGKTVVYDDADNVFERSTETKYHLSGDSAVHAYDYEEFEYHRAGVKLSLFYDNPDKLYVGLGYYFNRHKWHRVPYSFQQAFYVRYSIMQNAFSLLYDGRFAKVIGKWSGRVSISQDFVRWTNFYGLGNETENNKDKTNRYYQLRTNELQANLGLIRHFGQHHAIEVTGYFSAVEVINDPGRYVSDVYTPNELYYFEHHKYVGARIGYTFQDVDDVVVPEKGLSLYGGAAYTQNAEETKKGFASYNGTLQFYIPLFAKFSIASKNGITSVSGTPEFYQYASIGGGQNLRGYRRDRFWGQTAFYNNNELRWITNFKTYLMKGRIGLIGFVDEGRVWMPEEKSDKWHMGYGGGFLLAPFNLFSGSVTYGMSEEGGLIHIRINRTLLP